MSLKYPTPKRDDKTEDFHGTSVADPYHWLCDETAEQKDWIASEVSLYESFMATHDATTARAHAQLKQYSDYAKYSVPFQRGNAYYYWKNTGLQNQSVLYRIVDVDGDESGASVVLDPNAMSADGTISIGVAAFSQCGSYLAYGQSQSGSDWRTIRVLHIGDDGRITHLADRIEWIKFSSISWSHDNKGFFYCRYPAPEKSDDPGTETTKNQHQKVFYHRIGQDESEDLLVAASPAEPEWMFGIEVTDDGKTLVVDVVKDCEPSNLVWLLSTSEIAKAKKIELTESNAKESYIGWPKKDVITEFGSAYNYVANNDDLFFFMTNHEAPNYKIVSIDVSKGAESVKDIVAETDSVLESASCVHDDLLVLSYLKNVSSTLCVVHLSDGKPCGDLKLTGIGSVGGISGRRKDKEIFYKFTSFLVPGDIYRANPKTCESKIFRKISVGGIDSSKFTVVQEYCESKDGTKIPMFIIHKKGIELDGSHPTMAYAYGGFEISLTPTFSVSRVSWVANFGGVYCVANLRGGGEFGRTWHQAGTKERKQNVFDDFFAVQKHLVARKYTSAKKLAISGGSNGGLLMGACVTQQPQLCGAVLCHVGVLDMLRFQRFTIGYAWCSDYGNADESKEDFDYLYKYSPLHNIKKENAPWPALLALTSDHDDRVSPLHTFKFIAEVQHVIGASDKQEMPLLCRIEQKGGHGAGLPLAKQLRVVAESLTFAAIHVGASYE